MLISAQRLIDRSRRTRTREGDLEELRTRFDAAPSAREATPEAISRSRRLRLLRREMARLLSEVEACRSCARGRSEPGGRWDGGYCCGSRTLHIFTKEEVAMLKLGGTTPRDLQPPDSEFAGCAFRGERGCSLEPEHRPSICLRYICVELREELRRKPGWNRIVRLGRAMLAAFPEFPEDLPSEKNRV